MDSDVERAVGVRYDWRQVKENNAIDRKMAAFRGYCSANTPEIFINAREDDGNASPDCLRKSSEFAPKFSMKHQRG